MTAPLPPDPADVTDGDRAKATEITRCHREEATDCPFHGTADCGHRFTSCAAHDDARGMAWDECRWAPVAAALAAERSAVARPLLALAEEHGRWAAINRDLADQLEGDDRQFHLGMAHAQEASRRNLRAVVAAALGETGGGQ